MIGGLAHGDPGLYALLLIVVLLIGVVGLVIRAIVDGRLVPKATVDALVAERDNRITAQAEALVSLTDTNATLVATNAKLTDAVDDLAEASHMNLKVSQALHGQLKEA
jgi:cell division protein FtsB